MKAPILFVFGILYSTFIFAQGEFYINPSIGIVWNDYQNTNERITGNEDVSNIFWDNDWIVELLAGYKFNNDLVVETGLIYHEAVNRYYSSYPQSNFTGAIGGGGYSVSPGEGYLNIPLNIKYNIDITDNLNIIPYMGAVLSTHFTSGSPYYTYQSLEFSSSVPPMPIDTLAISQAYRPNQNNLLLNLGVDVEYRIFKNLFFTLSGNFTRGFDDINILEVEVFQNNNASQSGEVIFQGNTFYLSGGFRIPIELFF